MLEEKKSEEKSLLVLDPSMRDLKPECSSVEHKMCWRHAELRTYVRYGSDRTPCVSVDPLTTLAKLIIEIEDLEDAMNFWTGGLSSGGKIHD
jgi:hypothetical protein